MILYWVLIFTYALYCNEYVKISVNFASITKLIREKT